VSSARFSFGKAMASKKTILLSLYDLLWTAALPALAVSPRLREGWSDRLLVGEGPEKRDVWIQAASGGEAYLAIEIVRRLLSGRRGRILLSSGTSQGLGVLLGSLRQMPRMIEGSSVRVRYFPFDMPRLMRKALRLWRPRVVVLLETELWPGLLWACREARVPVVVLNGRLSGSSLKGYGLSRGFWESVGPREIHAVSPEDGERFRRIFTASQVRTMKNIKFDRIAIPDTTAGPTHIFDSLLPETTPLLVLGSVRKEEEGDVLKVIRVVTEVVPEAVIALFPRHMHRLKPWERVLESTGVPWEHRSKARGPLKGGTILLCDRFGELNRVYGRAQAVFVGGTLRPCGGQNFLEPLRFGLVPCIGPHWDHFGWVGRAIVEMGLVREVRDWRGLARRLVRDLVSPVGREEILPKVAAYLEERTGGAEKAAEIIVAYL
jgi:3-deoxy-D-manno-octulosonic-acid transferase